MSQEDFTIVSLNRSPTLKRVNAPKPSVSDFDLTIDYDVVIVSNLVAEYKVIEDFIENNNCSNHELKCLFIRKFEIREYLEKIFKNQ